MADHPFVCAAQELSMSRQIVNLQATFARASNFPVAAPAVLRLYAPMNAPVTPAARISRLHRGLRIHFENQPSPVAEFMAVRTLAPFRVLVATILSARTKDQTTAAVSERLFKEVRGLDDLQRISLPSLTELLYPVGFYRTKARMLKQLPGAVQTLFGGRIPDTIEELVQLPGVGRKTANLVVSEAFDKPGICVDVHVHRISNRLGLVRTRTPLETEMTLRRILPKRFWKTWNRYLVAFGQTLCTPRKPRCAECPIRALCRRIGVRD
jgi:endonuclease III